MLAKLNGCGLLGCDGYMVGVECDVSNGFPAYTVGGLPDPAIKESKERVMTAIKNSSFHFPAQRITINLAPSDLKKEGAAYDLPIALGILMATRQVSPEYVRDYCFVGSLSLGGDIVSIPGVLPMVLTAREYGFKGIVIPYDNKNEAGIVDGIKVYPMKHLTDVVAFLNDENAFMPYHFKIEQKNPQSRWLNDFEDVHGQSSAKRALVIAAAGAHNILLSGPPGSGKSMMAKAFPSILPDLSMEEILEITKIYSSAGCLKDKQLIMHRPFRNPHHTISASALVGGGSVPRPGEVSLAHLGVLYLDELPEFSTHCLETLRQPVEDHEVTIARVNATITYPSSFMLVASMNPCPCGYFGDPTHECRCSESEIRRYMGRLSGPLLDRIDIRVEVPSPRYNELITRSQEESSYVLRKKVNAARTFQNERFKEEKGIFFNSQLNNNLLEKYCILDEKGKAFMEMAYRKLNLSARGYHRILKLARTIADLEASDVITVQHLSEAVQYRVQR